MGFQSKETTYPAKEHEDNKKWIKRGRPCYRRVTVRVFQGRQIPRGIIIDRGYIHVRVYSGGRQIQKCVGPENQPGVVDDAITLLHKFREQLRLGKADSLIIKERSLPMSEACDIYYQHHSSKLISAKSSVNVLKHIKEYFKNTPVDRISPMDIEDYQEHRLDEGASPSTLNGEHQCIKSIFSHLVKWKIAKIIDPVALPTINPGKRVQLLDKDLTRRTRLLTHDEYKRLMEAATPQLQRVIDGAIHTLLRRKDLLALTKRNINPTTRQLEGIQFKTNHRYAIPINDVVQRLIDTAPGEKIFDDKDIKRRFERLVKKVGLVDFQFRDLRRTGAKAMHTAGVDLATVSSYLGHRSLLTTRHYIAAQDGDLRKGADIMERTYTYDLETPLLFAGAVGRGHRGHAHYLKNLSQEQPVTAGAGQ